MKKMLALCKLKAFKSLLNKKILDWSKLKAFAEDNLNVIQILKFALGWVENIAGKKEKMLVTSIFSFFHNVFQRLLSLGR